MKVMFYGGCHALILERIFSRYGLGENEYVNLRNYELIQKGLPFPFDLAKEQDVIVFSPVRRKEYASEILLDFCAKYGIKAISYPWMQWQALYPFSGKGPFLGGTSWNYNKLFEGLDNRSYEILFEKASGKQLDEAIYENFEISHNQLKSFEHSFQTNITVSEFILRNYRYTRLFLTPDHPTKALYSFLVKKVSRAIGIEIQPDFYHSAIEPQRGIKLPLIPRVSEVFNLAYRDSDFENNTAFGSSVLNWSDYLRLYTDTDARIFQASSPTKLKRRPASADTLADHEKMTFPKGAILVATLNRKMEGHIEVSPVYLGEESKKSDVLSGRWFMYERHWTSNRIGLI